MHQEAISLQQVKSLNFWTMSLQSCNIWKDKLNSTRLVNTKNSQYQNNFFYSEGQW